MFSSLPLRPYWDLVVHKAWADFRAESERSYLGVAWWILDPVINTTIYYLVFGVFMRHGGEDYIPALTTGIVTWLWFFAGVNGASRSIMAHVSFVRQVSFNKIVFPLSSVLMCTYQFGFSLVVLFCVYGLWGIPPQAFWLLLPVLLVVQLLLILAAGLVLGAIVPFVPDLANLVSYGLRLMFFLSCVMYKLESLSPRAQFFLKFNPMVHVISAYRDILMYARMPDWPALAIIALASLAGICAGAWLIWRFNRVYAKRIVR